MFVTDAAHRDDAQAGDRQRRQAGDGGGLSAGCVLRSSGRFRPLAVWRQWDRRWAVLHDAIGGADARYGRKRAMEFLLTGEMIDAATALDFGLVNRVVPAEHLVETVSALAEKIAAKAPEAIRLGKAAVAAQAGMSLAEAYASASRVMVEEDLMADDAIEGIGAFLDKRSPREAG